jgi:hypothetical protein
MPIPFVPILALVGGAAVVAELFKAAKGLFGTGEHVDPRALPPSPQQLLPGTSTSQERDRNKNNADDHGKIGDHAGDGNDGQGQAGETSRGGRDKVDEILAELQKVTGRNGAAGSTPETESANDQAIRDGLKQLRDTITGADDTHQRLAGQLPMPAGMGVPGLGGMPGFGGGMGMNPLSSMGGAMPGGGLGGLNPLAGDHPPGSTLDPLHPLTPPAGIDAHPAAPPVNPIADHPIPGGGEHGFGGPGQHVGPAGVADSHPGHHDTPQPDNPAAREVTASDGTKTTAPTDIAAGALRAALANPGATNQAAAAYQAAGDIQLPTDGQDPGTSVPSGQVEPGDIARWDDPPRDLLIFGNSKVIDPTGKLVDLDTMLPTGVFNGFFRPSIPAATATTHNASATETAHSSIPSEPAT